MIRDREKTMACVYSMSTFLAIISILTLANAVKYEPNWKSLDSRPLPSWYDSSKIGIFLHWGVFSVPAFDGAWFWFYWRTQKAKKYVDFMKKNYPPNFTYADFAKNFRAEFYDPDEWANIFSASGARYVVLVSKHHEGFTLWPSKYSWNWNAKDVGPNRDLVGDLATAVRKKSLHFGMYHSLFEFYNPLYLQDKANHFKTQTFVENKAMPELYEIVNKYKPEVIWSDGDWEAKDTYWNSTNFLAWLYNESPVKDTVVTNDRWGSNTRCKHGGFWNCNDRFNPGKIIAHKWENCMTVDKQAWAYRRDVDLNDFYTIEELLGVLAETISCGGNLLLNVGPTADGRIVPIFEERLRQMGKWLEVNGEAIYDSKPWFKPQDNVTESTWYTTKSDGKSKTVYAIVLNWPKESANGYILSLGLPQPTTGTTVKMLGYENYFNYKPLQGGGINIDFPVIPFKKLPTTWAWVLKIEGLKNA
ncbi:hypothetical protein KUTeg_004315 [Tegillarca granosa]|uniref:alpha-L-fucosidase n=1 Tax=Tegillarca granosa TaxID=220873 RepID=A0ABQ9FPN5_TEGGR|nr:hypothetical protein KUTeg_004315 [Tegillarca granosa]